MTLSSNGVLLPSTVCYLHFLFCPILYRYSTSVFILVQLSRFSKECKVKTAALLQLCPGLWTAASSALSNCTLMCNIIFFLYCKKHYSEPAPKVKVSVKTIPSLVMIQLLRQTGIVLYTNKLNKEHCDLICLWQTKLWFNLSKRKIGECVFHNWEIGQLFSRLSRMCGKPEQPHLI